jgi:hypothetical protein
VSEIVEQPIAEDAAAPPVVAEETPETPVPEAERDVEADTLEIPDSSQPEGKAKYVPASALAGARAELRTLKADLHAAKEGSAKAERLEQQIAAMQAQIQQLTPYVQAYQAAVQQQQPVEEDDSEAVDLARTLDLYKPDGTPDVDKAKKTLALMDKRAKSHAEAQVAPIQQRNTAQASQYNLQRALNTQIGGVKPDAAILKGLWQRLDPALTADEQQAKHLVIQAIGMTVMQNEGKTPTTRTATGQFTKTEDKEIPPPLHTEKAGGKDTPGDTPMSEMEKRMAKEMGLSDKEYLERASQAPWLKRR